MVDSYRPNQRVRDPPPSKPLADRMTFGNGGDSYRPGGQSNSEFTFESNHSAPRFPPTGPANPGPRPTRSNRSGGNRGGRRDQNGRGHANGFRGGRGSHRRQQPHERALLMHRDDGSEQMLGVSDGVDRFLNVDDLSNDEEADMDESDDSANAEPTEDGQPGNRKAARTRTTRADGDEEPQFAPGAPKWSNPDPYTALPPPSETTGVKRDVVQLIRKAKNQAAEKAASNNAVAANDDFISFGDTEVDDAPGLRMYEDDEPMSGRASDRAPPHHMQDSLRDYADADDEPRRDMYDSYQPRASGGRKRKADSDVAIVDEWHPRRADHPTPWATDVESYRHLHEQPDKWLHNEILDFYDWVAPQQYEHDARHKLVQRIADALSSQRWFPHDTGRILCFGSYPAGLYLPTADMDLVYASDRHYNGGPPVLGAASDKQTFKKTLYKASHRLQRVGIAVNPTVIANAKVPIIKFKDRVTDIDVDISFENLTGVQAQATFDQWKRDYPDLVYMVALVKQLLVMRGLNEVHSGGLGGFSIICLIVSYIQHSKKAENLGECFLGFLKYYGKDFDLSRDRIQMNPPGIMKKTPLGIDGRPEKPRGLSIQDPNKPDNNISGGSHKALEVLRVFSVAYDTLCERMKASKIGSFHGASLLDSIIGANYAAYIKQRRHLKNLPPAVYKAVDKAIEDVQMNGDEFDDVLHYMFRVQKKPDMSRVEKNLDLHQVEKNLGMHRVETKSMRMIFH